MNPLPIHFTPKKFLNRIALLLIVVFSSSCTYIISPITGKMANNLAAAILNSDDPQTVADGAPSYLLLVSSFLRDDPENESLLRSAATLHSAYASVFVKEPTRAAKMSAQALYYALKAVCSSDSDFCVLRKSSFDEYKKVLAALDDDDVENWYVLGTSWAGWIQKNPKDWNAIAELARVKLLFDRLLKLEPEYKQGNVHLYAAVLNSLLPPALGGKPEIGRAHFEQAIKISNGKNLMVKVLFAEKYAKLVFNKKLHDQLLNEVLITDPIAMDLTLMNTLAQQQAKVLLAASEDYF